MNYKKKKQFMIVFNHKINIMILSVKWQINTISRKEKKVSKCK